MVLFVLAPNYHLPTMGGYVIYVLEVLVLGLQTFSSDNPIINVISIYVQSSLVVPSSYAELC